MGTVRVRMTVGAVGVVTGALVVGSLALVSSMRATLTDEVRAGTRVRATEIARALDAGREPVALTVRAEDEELVQVVAADGGVVAASSNVVGRPPVVRLRSGESAVVRTPIDEDEFVAVAVATSDGRRTVVVARALADVLESTRVVTRLLVIGLPVLALLVGVIVWRVVGRALAPVEAIRTRVDEISSAELYRRVPVRPGTDEITRLAATMNRMLDRLEKAQAGQRRFVSDASHELRSPVASIRQHAEVALRHPGRTTVGELAETVLTENLRVQRLIEDLLLLARAGEHTLELHRRPVDLDDLVFDEARRLRAGTLLRVDTKGVSGGRVQGDEAALRRVLRNLGDNAGHYARERVAFVLAERDGVVELTLDDDGPGIPEAERERVFGRFVRLDDARDRNGGGSGLGLAIVAELVHAHGGKIAIHPSPLGGTQIQVVLPA